jgi:hypothetical protein
MCRTVTLATVFLLGAYPLATGGNGGLAKRVSFAAGDLNKVPQSWKAAQTGKGTGSVWKVVADDSAPSKTGHVLAQTAASTSKSMFNLCVLDKGGYKDVEVTVPFKAMAGKEDQGGGLVWRYQDENNYYVARANPLEDNFRLYKVVNGKRIQLATADVEVPSKQWHTLRIQHVGDQINCSLNGKKLLEAKDNTIAAAGRIGLWTKADAQTYFDALMVRNVKK